MDQLYNIFQFAGAIALGGGGLSLIVYQAFKYLAAKWLDARFEERLQALKHEQQKEIEQLRLKVSTLLDRAVKLHQREFDVLPEAWANLNDAYWYVRSLVSPVQSYPDLDHMNVLQQAEFIAVCPLQPWQKKELGEVETKTEYYQKAISWHKLSEAERKSSDAYAYLIKNGIFITEDLRTQFTTIHDLFWNALSEHKVNEEYDIRPRKRDLVDQLAATGDDLMKELERQIHVRLWPSANEP